MSDVRWQVDVDVDVGSLDSKKKKNGFSFLKGKRREEKREANTTRLDSTHGKGQTSVRVFWRQRPVASA